MYSAGGPDEGAAAGVADTGTECAAPEFASDARWTDHFERHGKDLGYASPSDYLSGAQRLIAGREGVLTYIRANGDRLFYDPATNEFAVLAQDGLTIRTYFAPDNGYDYWLSQVQK